MNKEIKIIVLGSLLTIILTLSIFTGLDQNIITTNGRTEVSIKKLSCIVKLRKEFIW